MKCRPLEVVLFFILLLYKICTNNAQTLLATACTKLANNMTSTYYDQNGLCNFFVRIGNVSYDAGKDICDNTFYSVQSTCQVVMFKQKSEIDAFVGKNLLKTTDKFLIGLRRTTCNDDWTWEYYNSSKIVATPPMGEIPTLPTKGADCTNLYVAYNGATFVPVPRDFSTDIFGCTCGINQALAQSSTMIPKSVFETSCPLIRDSQYPTNSYFDKLGRCNLGIRVANFSYDYIANRCNSLVARLNATCQVMHRDSFTDMTDEFTYNLLQQNDSTFFGLDRSSCADDWRWHYNNGTARIFTWEETPNKTGDLTPQIIPDKNQNCSQNVLLYQNGKFATVDKSTTPTTVFLCTCANDNLGSPSTTSTTTQVNMGTTTMTTIPVNADSTQTTTLATVVGSGTTTTTTAGSMTTTTKSHASSNTKIGMKLMIALLMLSCFISVWE